MFNNKLYHARIIIRFIRSNFTSIWNGINRIFLFFFSPPLSDFFLSKFPLSLVLYSASVARQNRRKKLGRKGEVEEEEGRVALFARTREIALTSVIKIQSTFDIYQGPV